MRRLLLFSVGFMISCGLCIWLLPAHWILYAAGIAFLITCVLRQISEGDIFRKATVILLGLEVGFGWFWGYNTFYLSKAAAYDGKTVSLCATAADYSYETNYGTGVDAWITLEGSTFRSRLYLKDDIALEPADTLTGRFTLRYTMSDTGDDTYHPGYGVFILASAKDDILIDCDAQVTLRHYPAVLARKISNILTQYFPEDTVSFAGALLLGDTSGLDYETDTALKISGIRHVVAVSGLHVSILFACIEYLSFRNRFLSLLIGLPVLLLFAGLAGFTPSVTRACIMCAVMALGNLTEREYDGLTSLSVAVLIMTAINPMVLTAVGFQLSVASVAGIFLFYEKLYNWLRKILGKGSNHAVVRWIRSSTAVTLSATALSTPLCAVYFGVVSIVGVLTNLLTLWVITLVFCGIIAVCLLQFIWPAGTLLLAKIISVPIRYILMCAKIFSRFPLAAVYTNSTAIVIWLIVSYVLLAVFCLRKKSDPNPLILGITAGLLAAVCVTWVGTATTDVTLTVLDVGQGQSILLHSDGKTVLIDCGGDSDQVAADAVLQTLRSRGISRIDAAIITHGDRDHVGGLENLMKWIQVDTLWVPTELAHMQDMETTDVVLVDREMTLTFGKTLIRVFGSYASQSDNENCLCVLFEKENYDILITGDRSVLGENRLMYKTKLPQVDVLIAGHHGSANSTGEALLRQIRPETVIISAGKDNPYGHPAPELLQRLENLGCEIRRTDLEGTINIRR